MTKYAQLVSVSDGTMRAEDLIPAFSRALKDAGGKCKTKYRQLANIDRLTDSYWESEEPQWDLESLFNALDSAAPPYCYFGAHKGDGADYGFWVSWDSLDEDCLGKEAVVRRMAAGEEWTACHLPGYVEYVLEVNDHGNATLFTRNGDEVWSVV